MGLFLLLPHTWVGLGLVGKLALVVVLAIGGSGMPATVMSRQFSTGKSRHVYITYRFADGSGNHSGSASVSPSRADVYPVGTTVRVRALRVGPKVYSELAGEGAETNGFAFMCVFALFWNGVLYGLFYAFCLVPLSHRKLLRQGQPAVGKVTGKEVTKGKSTSYHVRYSYSDDFGQTHNGKMTVAKLDFEGMHVGQPVTVFHDPMRPRRSVLYECCQYALRTPGSFR